MQKEILLDILLQNEMRFWATFGKINAENADLKLNERTASAAFIYRHVSETMNRLGWFLGITTNIENTTIGQNDTGQGRNLEASRLLAEQDFAMLKNFVETTPDDTWLEPVETPFFGTVSKARFFAFILFHNSYHLGQLGLTLVKGEIHVQAID
ncbi:MAG TPA: DinB family protein [Mucilaginibacter sp.]|jgi:hypothetical protein